MNDEGGGSAAETCGAAGRRSVWPAARWLGALAEDQQFLTVVLIWVACCLAYVLYIKAYGASLPWCDEWSLTAAACGKEHLTWQWLWEPDNEHRMPLTRLIVLVLARLWAWDWQAIHYIGLMFMALGALPLLVAARQARGRASLSDSFLCLLVLSPWHFATLMLYGYAYAFAGGLTCLAIGLAATRWPVRGVSNLALYFLLVLAVTFAAGPAGNLWAIGLCGVVVLALFDGAPACWKIVGILGTTLVTAVSAALIVMIPRVPLHEEFHSRSVLETVTAAARLAVGWIGAPPLQVIWPWALVALLVPGLLVLGRLFRDVAGMLGPERGVTTASRSWWGLGAVLLSTLAVALAMGHGRGRYPELWASRYLVLTQPIGIVLYLLMVRLRVPAAIPQMLALGMAVCVGWCWPAAIGTGEDLRARRVELARVLRHGTMPLSVVPSRFCRSETVGIDPSHQAFFLDCLYQLREANLTLFRDRGRRSHERGRPWPLAWNAEAGRLSPTLRRVTDEAAVSQGAIEVAAGCEAGGVATYQVEIPVRGSYQLCCRMRPSMQGQSLSAKVDDGPLHQSPLADGPDYRPCIFEQPFEMEAGKHDLRLMLPQPGMRLDLLELVPRRSKRQG
jgi:hypothetical protein